MLIGHRNDLMIVPSSNNSSFAKKVCDFLNIEMCKIEDTTFKDGEFKRSINKSTRGKDVFVIQTYFGNPNDRQKELELILDASACSAERVTVVIPYHPYSRGDWKAKRGDPISARTFANSLISNGVDGVLTMNVHSPQIAGFYPNNIDFNNLDSILLFGYHISKRHKDNVDNVVIVSPDVGYVKTCEKLAEEVGFKVAAIYKRRIGTDKTKASDLMGDVTGKHCILLDDETSTASSLVEGKNLLSNRGANSVEAYVTHNKLGEDGYARLKENKLELICTDTVFHDDNDCARTISVAPMFGEAIERIHTGRSTGDLFRYKCIVSLYDKIKSTFENVNTLHS